MSRDVEVTPFVIDIITLFPEAVESFLSAGIMGRAIAEGRLKIVCTNPRDFSSDVHRTADDAPFGGGPGMVMKIEPIVAALEHIEATRGGARRVLLSPSGQRFDQAGARRLAGLRHIVLMCGRYEGIDDRVREQFCDECLSVGDFVLNGGEVAALAVVEAVGRLLDGVVHNPESIALESFSRAGGAALEHPQYTRPSNFRGWTAPAPLSSGDHGRVGRWRDAVSRIRTRRLRPELVRSMGKGARGIALDTAVVVDARERDGFDIDAAGLASLTAAASGPVVVWTDRSISPGPGLVVTAAKGESLGGVRKVLRGKRKSRLVVVPVVMKGEQRPAWCLLTPWEVLDLASAHAADADSDSKDRGYRAVFVIAPANSPLRSGLEGGDPPSDFLLDLGGEPVSTIDGASGVENRGRVINPSQPQPGESHPRGVAHRLQHFLERWTQDFPST